MEREQSAYTEKCHWSESNIVALHLYLLCFASQISLQLNIIRNIFHSWSLMV